MSDEPPFISGYERDGCGPYAEREIEPPLWHGGPADEPPFISGRAAVVVPVGRCAWCHREAICRVGPWDACEDHADARHAPPTGLAQPDPFNVER